MKKVLTLIAMLLTLGAFAQHRGHRGKMHQVRQELTPGQQATLQSKRMALALDLDSPQQKAVKRLLESKYESRDQMREARKGIERDSSLTPESRFNRIEARLDRELAFRQELQKILTHTQYTQWKKIHQAINRARGKKQRERRRMGHGTRR